MAISASNNRTKRRVSADINITPLVDVMLVLLVIFMVTSPMMISGIDVELPKVRSQAIGGNDEPLVVSIDRKGVFYLQESPMNQEELLRKLTYIYREKPETRVFVKGDKGVEYGKVVEIFGLVKESGFDQVALAAELVDKP